MELEKFEILENFGNYRKGEIVAFSKQHAKAFEKKIKAFSAKKAEKEISKK